jgi:hypothetical protein
MEYLILLAGLGVALGGAVTVALADLWLSRLVLVYLDALEANVENLAKAVRTGSTDLAVTGIDLKRDKRQNRARSLKTLGWLALIVGLGAQIVAAYLAKPPP